MEYIELYLPNHHRAKTNGYVDEHIVIAEQKIGRKLLPNEVVHHIDKNRLNNNPNNLIVMKSISAHTAYHQGNILITTNEPYVYDCKAKVNYCTRCNKRIYYKNKTGLCRNCYNQTINHKVKNVPSKNELNNLIRNYSFVYIGKIYGVTDNAIRKWCKSYGLPYRRRDISLEEKL